MAAAAGVSIGTVSAVINNKKTVKESTRQKVHKAIKDLDYHPSTIARSLYRKQTQMIAFLVPDITNPGFSNVLKGITRIARPRGYSVFVGETEGSIEVADEYIEHIIAMQMDGVVLTLTWELARADLVEKLRRHDIEVVGAASGRPLAELDCFLYDEVQGAYQAGRYLCSLGHQKLAFIAPGKSAVGEQRLAGIGQALREFGGEFDEALLGHSDGYDEDAAYQTTLGLISKGMPFTCVVAFNDRMAVGVLKALMEQGFAVPEDVSLLTFGDTFAHMTVPRLTTMVNPESELAKGALLHLIAKIEGTGDETSPTTIFHPQLILRNSTSRPR